MIYEVKKHLLNILYQETNKTEMSVLIYGLKMCFNIIQGLKSQEIWLLHSYRYCINCRGNVVQMRPDGGYKC